MVDRRYNSPSKYRINLPYKLIKKCIIIATILAAFPVFSEICKKYIDEWSWYETSIKQRLVICHYWKQNKGGYNSYIGIKQDGCYKTKGNDWEPEIPGKTRYCYGTMGATSFYSSDACRFEPVDCLSK